MLTSTTFGLKTDVYASLTTTSGNVGANASGLQVGMLVQEPNTPHFRMLVQYDPSAGGTLPVASPCKFKTGTLTAGTYIVQEAGGSSSDFVIGTNDLAAVVIPVGDYFWMTVKGPASIALAASISAGTIVNAQGTAGQLGAASATAANQQTNIVSNAASGSGGATECFIY